MDDIVSASSLAETLRKRVPHCRVHEDVPDAALDTWSFVPDQRSLARIECRDAASVAARLETAAEMDVPMTIAGGRLDTWGRNDRSDHLIVDLRRMDEVSYDAAAGSGSVLFAHDFHGDGTRVPPDATAFRLREQHLVVAMTGQWAPGDREAAERIGAWTGRNSPLLAPYSLPGGYVNFLKRARESGCARSTDPVRTGCSP